MDLCERLIEKIAGENFLEKVFPCTPFKNFCTKEIAKSERHSISCRGNHGRPFFLPLAGFVVGLIAAYVTALTIALIVTIAGILLEQNKTQK